MDTTVRTGVGVKVNGVAIPAEAIAREAALHGGTPEAERAARRTLAVRELLLQRAADLGLVEARQPPATVTYASRAAEDEVIARVLDAEVATPKATTEECRRHYDAHPERYISGDLVEACHILFAVTPGTPVGALRAKAGETLAELRAHPELFAQRAQELSNCPSGAQGGSLGQFGRGQMVPEFDEAIFGSSTVGVLPQLATSRHGFHVVRVDHRIAGRVLPFEAAERSIAATLEARVMERALRQYVEVLAGAAEVEGVDLVSATSPLVQ